MSADNQHTLTVAFRNILRDATDAQLQKWYDETGEPVLSQAICDEQDRRTGDSYCLLCGAQTEYAIDKRGFSLLVCEECLLGGIQSEGLDNFITTLAAQDLTRRQS